MASPLCEKRYMHQVHVSLLRWGQTELAVTDLPSNQVYTKKTWHGGEDDEWHVVQTQLATRLVVLFSFPWLCCSTANEEDNEIRMLVYFAFLVFSLHSYFLFTFLFRNSDHCLFVIYNKLSLSTQMTKIVQVIVDGMGRTGLDLKVMTKNNCCTNKI